MTERLLGAEHSLTDGKSRAINLTIGGQQGAKRDSLNWVSGTLYTKQKLTAVLMRAPGGFRYMPDAADRVAILRALIEVHSKSITGLNSSLTTEVAETLVNNSGEVMQTVTRVSRERSNPVHIFSEVYGKAITTFFKDWSVELLQDPESGHPAIIGRPEYIQNPVPLLADMVSATVLYYEPNPERTGIVGTPYLCSNMFPLGVVDEAQRVLGEANEIMDVEISFTALTTHGKAVSQLARTHLESLTAEGMMINALTLAQDSIAPDVAATDAAGVGYVKGQEALADAIS